MPTTTTTSDKQPVNSQQESGPQFSVQNIYVKDISFESPKTPYVFGIEWKPKLYFDVSTGFTSITQDVYEVILHVVVTVNVEVDKTSPIAATNHAQAVNDSANNASKDQPSDPKKTFVSAFLIEVKQAGVFIAKNFAEEQIKSILSTTAPSILYPYAREAVANMVSRGGFPQLIMPPMNFEALYQRSLEEQRAKEKNKDQTTVH